MIELRLIRVAVALGRHRNFARAAEALHLSQPSLSRSIAALEDQLGVRLFDRSHRGIEPTAFGRVLLERGEALLGDEGALRREIQLLAGLDVGTLAVGAGPYAGNVAVASAVARLVTRYPRLHVEVEVLAPDAVLAAVLSGRFDVGVAATAGLGNEPRLTSEPLPQHKVYLACRPGHPLTRICTLTLKDVLAFPLVSSPMRGNELMHILKAQARGRVDADAGQFMPAITVNSFDLARQIAMQSDALFPGTDPMLEPDITAGRLVRLDFHIPAMTTQYGFVYLRNRTPSPAVTAFMTEMRAVEAALSAPGQSRSSRPVSLRKTSSRLAGRCR